MRNRTETSDPSGNLGGGRIATERLAPLPRGQIVMTRIVSFFGFVFGFVIISIALAGVSQQAGKVAAREEVQIACANTAALDDGYGLRPAEACQFVAN